MTPIEILMHEHQIILMVLGAVEREAQQIQDSGQVNAAKAEQMVDFIRNFADRCHHAKEEDLLFVRMQERGMPAQGGPIGVMLIEHVEGRRLIKAAAEALPDAANGDPHAVAAVSYQPAVVSMQKAGMPSSRLFCYLEADGARGCSIRFVRVGRSWYNSGGTTRIHGWPIGR